jgi:hypothetical protein
MPRAASDFRVCRGPRIMRRALRMGGFRGITALLRGSGQSIHAAVARGLGVCPGQQRVFNGSCGDVRIAWLLSSTNGAAVGSLRSLAAAVARARMTRSSWCSTSMRRR